MTRKYEQLVRFLRIAALLCAASATLLACTDRAAQDESNLVAIDRAKPPQYNELIAALPPLAPKSEVETSAEFLARKRQRLAPLIGTRFQLAIPASLGKCRLPEDESPGMNHDYVGLRYDADREELDVCALDVTTIPPSGADRRYGMVITRSQTTTHTSTATNVMGAEIEIAEKITNGYAFFVDVPAGSSAGFFAQGTIPMKLPAAKLFAATGGGRLVYDVELDPGSSNDVMTSSNSKPATNTKREGFEEKFIGVAVKVHSITLESSTGALIARFDLATETDTKRSLSLIPDPDSQTDAGKGATTRYGFLQTGEGGAYLNGRKVFSRGMGGALRIIALRQLGKHDVVVTHQSSGGSAGFVDVVLLDVAPDRTVKVMSADVSEFSGVDDPESQIRNVGKTLALDLGFVGGKHRKAVFDGNAISTVFEESGPTPIPENICKRVHEVLSACAAIHPSDRLCDDAFNKLSHAEMGGIHDAFAYPAQIEERFRQSCDSACESGSAAPFSQTKKEFCSAKRLDS